MDTRANKFYLYPFPEHGSVYGPCLVQCGSSLDGPARVRPSAEVAMGGWSCKSEACNKCTFRRPPNNFCKKCRPTLRGSHLKELGHQRGGSAAASRADAARVRAYTATAGFDAATVRADTASKTVDAATVRADTASQAVDAARDQATGSSSCSKSSTTTTVRAGGLVARTAGPCDYGGWRSLLQSRLTEMVSAFGLADAHHIAGVGYSILNRMEGARRPMPGDVDSLASISISLSGVGGVDAKVASWHHRIHRTGRQMARVQAQWIVALPFSCELESPNLQSLAI